MASWHGNAFRITGSLFTCHRWIPLTKGQGCKTSMFYFSQKQSSCQWFGTSSRSYDVTVTKWQSSHMFASGQGVNEKTSPTPIQPPPLTCQHVNSIRMLQARGHVCPLDRKPMAAQGTAKWTKYGPLGLPLGTMSESVNLPDIYYIEWYVTDIVPTYYAIDVPTNRDYFHYKGARARYGWYFFSLCCTPPLTVI